MQGAQEGTLARDAQILEDKEVELEPSKPELGMSPKVWHLGGWHLDKAARGRRLGREAVTEAWGHRLPWSHAVHGSALSDPWGSRLRS